MSGYAAHLRADNGLLDTIATFLRGRPVDAWKSSREYWTNDATEHLSQLLTKWLHRPVARAFFLRIPPGGKVHRHTDAGDVETWHLPIATNAQAFSCWADADGDHRVHLEAGHLYQVDRKVEHWAFNDGSDDRTHLIIEFAP